MLISFQPYMISLYLEQKIFILLKQWTGKGMGTNRPIENFAQACQDDTIA